VAYEVLDHTSSCGQAGGGGPLHQHYWIWKRTSDHDLVSDALHSGASAYTCAVPSLSHGSRLKKNQNPKQQKNHHRSGRVFQRCQLPKEGGFREQKH